MTLNDIVTLMEYHYWARDRVLDAAAALSAEQYTRDMGSSFRSVQATLMHLYSAEWAWHQRWLGTSPTAMLAPDLYQDLESLRTAWSALETNVRRFLGTLQESDVERVFEYRSFAGQPGRSTYGQTLLQLVNHGSYHRGQLTTMFRQMGASPAKSMDLIAFFREHQVGG
jgi:uncharacterized damage-inducible protein DinB